MSFQKSEVLILLCRIAWGLTSNLPESTYACNPVTTRGASTKLSGTKDGRLVYTNGKIVIVRSRVMARSIEPLT